MGCISSHPTFETEKNNPIPFENGSARFYGKSDDLLPIALIPK